MPSVINRMIPVSSAFKVVLRVQWNPGCRLNDHVIYTLAGNRADQGTVKGTFTSMNGQMVAVPEGGAPTPRQ